MIIQISPKYMMFIFLMEKAFCNKPPCSRQCHCQFGRFHFPFLRKAALDEGDHPKLGYYKSPCPLRHDWIHSMPENSPHNNTMDPWSATTAVSVQ